MLSLANLPVDQSFQIPPRIPRNRMPRKRRPQRPPPREGSQRLRAARSHLFISHFILLILWATALTYGLRWLPCDPKRARLVGWVLSCGASILLFLKLLDERPAATRAKARHRIWSGVEALSRDALRMISVASARSAAVNMSVSTPSTSASSASGNSPQSSPNADTSRELVSDSVPPSTGTSPLRVGVTPSDHAEGRTDELLGIIAGFPVALQHHLLGTRALPHPPLCDLLPQGYLSSLKRTEARVRFASAHAGPSGSSLTKTAATPEPETPTKSEKKDADDDWDLAGKDSDSANANGNSTPVPASKKSNLHAPYPVNMPLSLLRLMEAYILGLADLPQDRGGWSVSQSDRALAVVTGLNALLSEAEGVYAAPKPNVDVRACVNLLLLVFPTWFLHVLPGWRGLLVTVIAGGLIKFAAEIILADPDAASPNHPLRRAALAVVHESLDTCPALARYYRTRLVQRLGAGADEVLELDRRNRRRDEWLPTFQ